MKASEGITELEEARDEESWSDNSFGWVCATNAAQMAANIAAAKNTKIWRGFTRMICFENFERTVRPESWKRVEGAAGGRRRAPVPPVGWACACVHGCHRSEENRMVSWIEGLLDIEDRSSSSRITTTRDYSSW